MDGYLSDWSDCCLMLCHTYIHIYIELSESKKNSSWEKKNKHFGIINSHKFTLSHSILRRIFLLVNVINGQFHDKMDGWKDTDYVHVWIREWEGEWVKWFSIYLAMHFIYDAFSSLLSSRILSTMEEKKTSNSKLIFRYENV